MSRGIPYERLQHGSTPHRGSGPLAVVAGASPVRPRPARAGPAPDVAVEEQQGAERLVLGGGGHPPVDRQRAQEASDFGRPHLRGVALAEEEDVASDPRDVGFLGAAAVMASTEAARTRSSSPGLGGPAGLVSVRRYWFSSSGDTTRQGRVF